MAAAHPLTDHDEIREWAESRGAKPTCVRGTGGKGDTGMIRLDFPGYSGEGKLQPISWDDWFASFDDNNLALLVQDARAQGGRSHFNKLVARRTAAGLQHSRRSGRTSRRASSATARKKAGRKTSSRPKSASRRKTSTRSASRSASARSTSSRTTSSSSRSSASKRSSGGRAGSTGRPRKRSTRR